MHVDQFMTGKINLTITLFSFSVVCEVYKLDLSSTGSSGFLWPVATHMLDVSEPGYS
jgi:hypothetical protein